MVHDPCDLENNVQFRERIFGREDAEGDCLCVQGIEDGDVLLQIRLLRPGQLFFFAGQQIHVHEVVGHPELLHEGLGHPAPHAGAQAPQENLLVLRGELDSVNQAHDYIYKKMSEKYNYKR